MDQTTPRETQARIVVTGFGPFLDVTENPSAEIVKQLGYPFEVLEVSFDAADRFVSSLDPDSFDRLLMLGVARGRTHVCPELFARNQIGHTKDVAGNDRFGPVEEGAPLLLEGGLWTPEIIGEAAREPTIRVSFDAGNYLCNYIYYRAQRRFPTKRVGFLHVADFATIPVEEQVRLVKYLVGLTATGPTPA